MNPPPITSEQLQSLRRLGTCRVSNAIENFGFRLRNEGYSDSSIHCCFPSLGPMLGYAATLKVRSADPPTDGRHYLEHTNWWDHILSLPEPRVLAVEDADHNARSGAFLGEVHACILRALHCVGAVTNGSVRDLREVQAMGFHFFAGAPSVSHAYVHVVEIGGPVQIAGLKIAPGDLLLADGQGVLSVPAELAATIPEVAQKIAAQEQRIVSLCGSKEFSVEKLRTLIRELRATTH